VLVVDDQPDVADSLAELVGLLGHAARAAYTAEGAILLASGLAPDVVLTDLAMPRVDGLELARWLRAQAAGRPSWR
jgi:CheY-like chemotaxis protein